eukprot:g8691.t1
MLPRFEFVERLLEDMLSVFLWLHAYVAQTSSSLECRSPLGFSNNVHVLTPIRNPDEKTLYESVESLCNRLDKNFGSMEIHFGLDEGDNNTMRIAQTVMNKLNNCSDYKLHKIWGRPGDVSTVVSSMFLEIPERAYFLRFNDDAIMQTLNWNRLAIEALAARPYPNVGIAKLNFGSQDLQIMSFVSSVHKDVFGVHMGIVKQSSVTIRHTWAQRRYNIVTIPKQQRQHLIREGHRKLKDYIECLRKNFQEFAL